MSDSAVTEATPETPQAADLVAEIEALGKRMREVARHVGELIFGQERVVNEALITLLSGGHALLVGAVASWQSPRNRI